MLGRDPLFIVTWGPLRDHVRALFYLCVDCCVVREVAALHPVGLAKRSSFLLSIGLGIAEPVPLAFTSRGVLGSSGSRGSSSWSWSSLSSLSSLSESSSEASSISSSQSGQSGYSRSHSLHSHSLDRLTRRKTTPPTAPRRAPCPRVTGPREKKSPTTPIPIYLHR